MIKKSKKGLSQLDWIISLTFFMFYLVWFFVYAVPVFSPPTEQATSFDEIHSNLRAETLWNITKIPVIARSNISGNNELLYINFPYAWNTTSFGFENKRGFALEEGKLFFLANLTNTTNLYSIYYSDSNYSTSDYGDITSTSAQTTINSVGIKAEFASSMLTKLQRENDIPIENTSFHINTIPFPLASSSFSSTNISAKYTAVSEQINLSTYLFSNNYRIVLFTYKNTITNLNSNLTISSDIRAYPHYFAHNEFKGDISYATRSCKTVYYDSISFYTNNSGLTFLVPDNSKIFFCTKNNSFILNITMNATNTTMQIIPYTGNYNNSIKYKSPYSAEHGIRDIITGLSTDKLSVLNNSDYETKRADWNYKGTGDFTITVKNSTNDVLLDFGNPPLETVNTYVDEREWWILDKYGSQEKAVVNIRVW